MDNVFVAYAGVDRPRIDDVWSKLLARGLVHGTPWVADQATVPGEGFADAIMRAIQDASLVVVLWSDHAARSSYVNYELGMAQALGKPILIVDLGSHLPPPAELGPVQVVDLQPAV